LKKLKNNMKKILYIIIIVSIFTIIETYNNLAIADDSTISERNMNIITGKYKGENLQIKNALSLNVGEEINYNLLFGISDDSETFELNSNDDTIIKANNNGYFKAISPGETYITLKSEYGTFLYEVLVKENVPKSINNYNLKSNIDYAKSNNGKYSVFVDAGHGGSEPGTISQGIVEKDLNLSIALKVERILKAKGVDVIMRRRDDSYLHYMDIAPLANTSGADAFVSIHNNSFNGKAYGTETWYYKRSESKKLAGIVQNKLIKNTSSYNRGIKDGPYYVVKDTKMPAALVECGFMDNRNEATKLKTNSYQQLIATAIANGVYEYLKANVTLSKPINGERVAGLNRYDTSYKVANIGWSSSDTVIIAPGGNYPDALCSAPLAAKYNAPILLAENKSLSKQSDLKNLLKKLGSKKAFIVGGTGVLSSTLQKEISSMGISTERLGGINRYETATLIADKVGSDGQIALVSGLGFADALSISSVAAQKEIPILLTEKSILPEFTKKYLDGKHIKTTYVVGGTGVVSEGLSKRLSNPIRLGGLNRYSTNKAIYEHFKGELNLYKAYMALGSNFPDALSVSALASKNNSFVFLSNSGTLEPDLANLINISRNKISKMYILGGPTFITNKILSQLNIKVN
jgi:N-acetylmuramoyl-L-alanine amidase